MAITYTPSVNFGAKDSLPTNDPDKVIKGSEFTTEFTAIQTAFSLAAPVASPTFTGTVTIPTADINGGNIDGTVIGAATPAAGSFTTGQFGTSLNVDGTVTADGLTVDTDTLHVDAVNNRVGIGTTSPITSFTLGSGTTGVGFQSSSSAFNSGKIAVVKPVEVGSGNGHLVFETYGGGAGGGERMRLTSTGNLLVGTTDTSPHELLSGEGVCIRPDSVSVGRTSQPAVALGRNGTDGSLAEFYKDGSTVGSIGSEGGDALYIQSGTTSGTGLLFTSNGTAIRAARNGSTVDATLDLGSSTRRFKDLYLSGGAYLGGTGAANKLDDYEEGTWTPIFAAASGAAIFNESPNVNMARYTKIGDTVTAAFYITYPSTLTTTASYSASAGLQLAGLPFLSNRSGNNDFFASIVSWYDNFTGYSGGTPMVYTNQNQTRCTFVHASGNNVSVILQSNVNNGGSAMIAQLIYKTTA